MQARITPHRSRVPTQSAKSLPESAARGRIPLLVPDRLGWTIRATRSTGYVPNPNSTPSALATATPIVIQENPAWKNGAFADALMIAVTPKCAERVGEKGVAPNAERGRGCVHAFSESGPA
jgi:hypothetical protein